MRLLYLVLIEIHRHHHKIKLKLINRQVILPRMRLQSPSEETLRKVEPRKPIRNGMSTLDPNLQNTINYHLENQRLVPTILTQMKSSRNTKSCTQLPRLFKDGYDFDDHICGTWLFMKALKTCSNASDITTKPLMAFLRLSIDEWINFNSLL